MELTVKQEQVLSLASMGLKDRLIADALGISVRTVQNHFARIYTKTRTNNRTGAVLLYMSTEIAVVKRKRTKRRYHRRRNVIRPAAHSKCVKGGAGS